MQPPELVIDRLREWISHNFTVTGDVVRRGRVRICNYVAFSLGVTVLRHENVIRWSRVTRGQTDAVELSNIRRRFGLMSGLCRQV